MKKIVLFFLASAVIVGFVFSSRNAVTQTPAKIKSLDLVELIDPSGTTLGKGWPMPDKDFYIAQIEMIEKNGGGNLTIYNICNPIPTPLSLHIEQILAEPDIYKVSEENIKQIRLENIQNKKINELNKSVFISRLDSYIVNFKPPNLSDYTYLDVGIKAAIKTIKLSLKSEVTCYLLIYSDFINDTPNTKAKLMDESLCAEINSVWRECCDLLL